MSFVQTSKHGPMLTAPKEPTPFEIMIRSPRTKRTMERYYCALVRELHFKCPGSEEHQRAVQRRLLCTQFRKGETIKWLSAIARTDPEFNGKIAIEYGEKLLTELFADVNRQINNGAR